MKIINKFKTFSRDIKIIIITVLIASCIGVYASGTCVISATADDVTYSDTTVQAAIDELYSMSQNYCPQGYECTPTLYGIMASNSVLDDRASTYVTSSSGIDFTRMSSDTNGKGIYEIASTKNDTYPIYYYRGEVDNNNVKFGGFCWKAIRTTDTGGVKLIYNGNPNGSGNCTNTTGNATQIRTSNYNSVLTNSLAYVGYMYGAANEYLSSRKTSSDLSSAYKYGNDVSYVWNNLTARWEYTLTNTMTSTGTWSNDYNTLNNNHYTCFSTGTTCSSLYYVYYTDQTNGAYYIELTNGKKVEDALNDMFSNTIDSDAKTAVDYWYSTNLSSYSNYIEDTIYCNDRSIGDIAGWDPNGGDTTKYLSFSPRNRMSFIQKPSLMCSRALDRFTVSSTLGNGALTYPIGLITSDEAMYAGAVNGSGMNSYYLYTSQSYWTLSPSIFLTDEDNQISVFAPGMINYTKVNTSFGIRPVISLKSTDVLQSGDGTSTNPYVIQTS